MSEQDYSKRPVISHGLQVLLVGIFIGMLGTLMWCGLWHLIFG